jgi:hypothetical protein
MVNLLCMLFNFEVYNFAKLEVRLLFRTRIKNHSDSQHWKQPKKVIIYDIVLEHFSPCFATYVPFHLSILVLGSQPY